MENIGATWASISWTAPLTANSPISHYEVIAREMDGQGVATMTTPNAATFLNVTGLLPGTAYELTVVAVSEGGDVIARSPESSSLLLAGSHPCIHPRTVLGRPYIPVPCGPKDSLYTSLDVCTYLHMFWMNLFGHPRIVLGCPIKIHYYDTQKVSLCFQE